MVFEQIEVLKKAWTDKYVAVDASQAELRRFEGQTGLVKTVNMSGRALVQFDANSNIGWYDIDLAYLKQIDAPLPKVVAKEKPKAEKPKAETKPAAAAKPAAGGKSVADILAAARGGKGGAAAPAAEKPAAKPAGKMSTADILAAARAKKGEAPAAEAPAAKVDPKKMSTADILAAARGKKAAAAPVAEEPVVPAEEATAPAPVPEPEPEPAADPAPVEKSAGGSKRGVCKTIAEMVDYCRRTDAS